MNQCTIQESIDRLREFGVAPSPQRVALFHYLRTHPVHPTAEHLHKALKPEIPTLSLTTVYNTRKTLEAKKALQTVIIEDGELRFDADMREHAHFKCLICGGVFDLFPAEGRPLVGGYPALPDGFELLELHLCLKGRCAQCHR